MNTNRNMFSSTIKTEYKYKYLWFNNKTECKYIRFENIKIKISPLKYIFFFFLLYEIIIWPFWNCFAFWHSCKTKFNALCLSLLFRFCDVHDKFATGIFYSLYFLVFVLWTVIAIKFLLQTNLLNVRKLNSTTKGFHFQRCIVPISKGSIFLPPHTSFKAAASYAAKLKKSQRFNFADMIFVNSFAQAYF